jgi:cell division GTPase FtsZ
VDILIVVSNDKLLEIVPEGVPLQEAFSLADEILRQVRMWLCERGIFGRQTRRDKGIE